MGEPKGILSEEKPKILQHKSVVDRLMRNIVLNEETLDGRDGQYLVEKKTNKQILEAVEPLAGTYELNNGVVGKYEITKSDLHNLIYETSKELKESREEIILKLRDIVERGEYVGWSKPDEGKQSDVAYFAYFNKDLGKKVYVAMRYMKSTKIFKPYAIYSETQFNKDRANKIEKGTPTI